MKLFYLFLVSLLSFQPCFAESSHSQGDYVRTTEHLETAIATFVKDDKKVDLVSAVHVGDKAYFQELNKRFLSYEVVLFELVADERIAKSSIASAKDSGSAVSGLQGGLAELLDLSFQLTEIDYTAKNFVHADLSPEQFSSTMDERGESTFGMLIKVMAASKRNADRQTIGDTLNSYSMLRLLMQPHSPKRAKELKRILAAEFDKMGTILEDLSGGGGTTLLEGRNDRALEVLKRELEAGQKNIAIFYGGAHLPDLAEKLERDFGFKHKETDWIIAWNLK